MKDLVMKSILYAYMGILMAVVGILDGIAWLCGPLDIMTNKVINLSLACWNRGSMAVLGIIGWLRSLSLNDMKTRILTYYECCE